MDNKQVGGAIKVYYVYYLCIMETSEFVSMPVLDFGFGMKLTNSKTYKLKNYFCL